jgi:hypothetical protein
MAGTIVADTIQADSTSTLVLKNGVANTPPTIQDSAGTQIGTFCRAWVNFNGNPVAIRASFNVTSITDNGGVGDYTVNFTNALPDANYATVATAGDASTNLLNVSQNGQSFPPTTTSVRLQTMTSNGVTYDARFVNVAIFR